MASLYFSDVLRKADIDPAKVKLIRHSLTDKNFKACYDAGKVYEYTCHQKMGFSKGYEYWVAFISGSGTLAKFHSIYKVGDCKPDTKDVMPAGLPESEQKNYFGEYAIYYLKQLDVLADF